MFMLLKLKCLIDLKCLFKICNKKLFNPIQIFTEVHDNVRILLNAHLIFILKMEKNYYRPN